MNRFISWIVRRVVTSEAFRSAVSDMIVDGAYSNDIEKLESRVDDIEGQLDDKLDEYGVDDRIDDKLGDLDLESLDSFTDLQARVSKLEDADDGDEDEVPAKQMTFSVSDVLIDDARAKLAEAATRIAEALDTLKRP